MSARAIPRFSRNVLKSGKILSESFLQPQRQKAAFKNIRNMQFQHVNEFAEAPVYRAMTKMSQMNRLSRAELGRIQVMLVTSLVSKSVSVTQMMEEMLKAIATNEEEDEGSGSVEGYSLMTMYSVI